MKGLMRMLLLFGPMIFRQYQKWQRNRSNSQASPKPNRHISNQQSSETIIEKEHKGLS